MSQKGSSFARSFALAAIVGVASSFLMAILAWLTSSGSSVKFPMAMVLLQGGAGGVMGNGIARIVTRILRPRGDSLITFLGGFVAVLMASILVGVGAILFLARGGGLASGISRASPILGATIGVLAGGLLISVLELNRGEGPDSAGP